MFDWLSPTLRIGSEHGSINEDQIDTLGMDDRAPKLWETIKNDKSVGPQRVNRLLWKVLMVNKRMFTWREWNVSSKEPEADLLNIWQCSVSLE